VFLINEKAQFRVVGMDCAEEVSLLRARLSRVAGVRELRFDVVQGRLEVEYATSQTSSEEIEKTVAATGMRSEPWRERRALQSETQHTSRRWLFWLSGAALLAGLIGQAWESGEVLETLLAHGHAGGEAHTHATSGPVLGLLLTAIIAGAWQTVPKALASLRAGRADMNLLVVISLAGASLLGEWAEAAALSFLFALAGRLETWSLGRAREAISELVAKAPGRVAVLHEGSHHGEHDGGEHEHLQDAFEVLPGSVVRVRPGEQIAFDGIVVRGSSEVNQAFVTGESVAVEKRPGEAVMAGTLNLTGSLDIRTTSAASDTLVARLIRMAGESSTRRAPSERFVDQFTRIYTPVILALATLVTLVPPLFQDGGWHEWMYQGMVVLLIACPCALVISTPVCVVAAITAAARRQVLIKGGAVLEETARLRALALDKTAALLAGDPKVDRVIPLGGRQTRRVLEMLAAVERSSEHPIAKAILREAESRGIFVTAAEGFKTLVELGVGFAESGDARFWAGSPRGMISTAEVKAALQEAEALSQEGLTVVACGMTRQGEVEVWALVALRQEMKAGVQAEIAGLTALGIEHIALLTGDMRANAVTAARLAGISEVYPELRAADKAARVAAMMSRYRHVAFVGDSVHDAEAMALAPVGIALGPSASDVTRESAGIIILPGDLGRLGFLISHARRTLRVIQQNVWLAVGAKVLFLAAAMTGSATLWMAVAADMGATLAVTLNGLRLLKASEHPRK